MTTRSSLSCLCRLARRFSQDPAGRGGFLVNDRIEALMQGKVQSLQAVLLRRNVTGVVVGYLADVVRDVHALDDRVRSYPSGAYSSTARGWPAF